jgi:hypothetical protein
MIEDAASKQSASRIDELAKIFVHATKVRESEKDKAKSERFVAS